MVFGRAIYCQLFDFRTGRSMILCPTPCILLPRRKFLLFQHEDSCMISSLGDFSWSFQKVGSLHNSIKKAYCDGIEEPQSPRRMERLTCCVLEHPIPHSLIPYGSPDEPPSSADGWVSLLPGLQWFIKVRRARCYCLFSGFVFASFPHPHLLCMFPCDTYWCHCC